MVLAHCLIGGPNSLGGQSRETGGNISFYYEIRGKLSNRRIFLKIPTARFTPNVISSYFRGGWDLLRFLLICSTCKAGEVWSHDGRERLVPQEEIRKEMERRKQGKEMLDFKKQQEDDKTRRIMDERNKEKAEEKAARDRVKQQIALVTLSLTHSPASLLFVTYRSANKGVYCTFDRQYIGDFGLQL